MYKKNWWRLIVWTIQNLQLSFLWRNIYYLFDLVLQNELLFEDVITLTLPGAAGEGPDGTKVNTVGKEEFSTQKNI